MNVFILSLALVFPLTSMAARAETCRPCQEVNLLASDWARVTPQNDDEVSARSSRIMKELRLLNRQALKRNSVDPEVVHAIVATLGIIYLHDDDPLDDELTHLRSALKNKAFRELFDQEVNNLPPLQKQKLMVGIYYIENPSEEDLHRD